MLSMAIAGPFASISCSPENKLPLKRIELLFGLRIKTPSKIEIGQPKNLTLPGRQLRGQLRIHLHQTESDHVAIPFRQLLRGFGAQGHNISKLHLLAAPPYKLSRHSWGQGSQFIDDEMVPHPRCMSACQFRVHVLQPQGKH